MDGYPYVSKFQDRHDVTRYRFRRGKTSLYLPGSPGEPQFEEHYQAACEGREPRTAKIIVLPGRVVPQSFGHAWQLVQKTAQWRALDAATKLKNERLTETFLALRVAETEPERWRDMPVIDFRRKHMKLILGTYAETPHKAKHLLTAVKRLLGESMDQEWTEFDVTQRMKWRPEYGGWRAWTDAERTKFEARWKIGSMPRAAYALALWTGARRSEVASQLWSDADFGHDRITVRQIKGGGKALRLLMLPMLREALEPLTRRADTIITTEYGKPFSEKSLTGMMAHWTDLAGMNSGCTFHGLRKTLGKMLAEEGATAKQSAGILGHDELEQVELYSREAEQERLAVDGLALLLKRYG